MREIMVIDDEEPIRRAIRDALEDIGHTVTTYDTCHKALKDLNNPDFPRPRLIILDVMMPKLDGYRFHIMLQANERTRRIPLIII
ncbi:MAG: response regulator, partial [Proteobacteria bacterium]|nr:response regulator [Pseudomonadota bacterium]